MTHHSDEAELGAIIPVHYHYQMLLDEARMAGFKKAIEMAVPRGGTVVELGGGTGVLSFFAAKFAAKVWCVERQPQMVAASRRFLELNGASEVVEMVETDACDFVPPTAVDVVVCEMLHSALLREKQIEVIAAFRDNYTKIYGPTLPRFIPEATILGLQPVEYDFTFVGYTAPITVFSVAYDPDRRLKELSDPILYSLFQYNETLPKEFNWTGTFAVAHEGTLNAFRFITKNILAIVLSSRETVDWHNFNLMIPLDIPLVVKPGMSIQVSLNYKPGARIEDLSSNLKVELL